MQFRSTMSPSSSVSDCLGTIQVRGARENNLKNISVDLPRRRITVFTGVSGSGKSSLVFDTIAAESQRLLNETFPTFVQTFLPRYGQPDVDVLANLSTAIIVDQQRMGGNPRSTLGTATDIYTLLRVLFSRLGKPTVPHALALSFNLKTAARSSVSQSACASENLAPEETAERGAQNELPS